MTQVKKRPIGGRALVAVMAAGWGLCLPISGLVLHAYSHHQALAGRHGWFMFHVIAGALFTVFAVWHAILNRRALLNHFRAVAPSLEGAAGKSSGPR